MDTILFITDLNARSRVYQYAGAREVMAAADKRLEEIELVRLTEPLEKCITYWHPVGIILEGSGDLPIPTTLLNKFPIVHLDPPDARLRDPSAFTVLNDAEAIADLAFQELVNCGCTSFAFIGWNPNVGWCDRRKVRFAARVAALGRPCAVLQDALTFGNKAEFAERLRPFLTTLPKGCGLFAVNDAYASDTLDVCAELGYAVPGDFMLVGVDDDPAFCDHTHPSLTSVRPSFRTSGRLAADLLLKRLANPTLAPQKLIYSPLGLTRRLSTRNLKESSQSIDAALDYIRREACNGLTAADVIKFLNLTERAAEVRFKSATGRRIIDEIVSVRMERVLELLKNPQQTIEPIANLCGWGSAIYLKRLFKARMGLTMSEWRRQYLAEQHPTA